jgi:hypothetical protein
MAEEMLRDYKGIRVGKGSGVGRKTPWGNNPEEPSKPIRRKIIPRAIGGESSRILGFQGIAGFLYHR